MRLGQLFDLIFSLPKTIYVNFHLLKFKHAKKLPILINHSVKLGDLSGSVELDRIRLGIIKIGYGGSYNMGRGGYFKCEGKMHFQGKASFGRGIQLLTEKNGNLEIGDYFRCNANCIINSGNMIKIGNDVLLSWNVTIIDGDGHKLFYEEMERPIYAKIEIGNHVWICGDATLLKNATIHDGSIVAAKAVVSKNMEIQNAILGTNHVIRTEVRWEE